MDEDLEFEEVPVESITVSEPVVAPNEFYGYDLNKEDHELLATLTIDAETFRQACFGDYPEEIDPRKWHRIENQKSMGSCFPAGTKILMSDGQYKNIENIKVGDRVISHTGESRKVNQLFQRPFTGNLIKLFVQGTQTALIATNNHKIPTINLNKLQSVEAKPIEDINIGDYVQSTRGNLNTSKEYLNVSLSNYQSIAIDEEFGFMAGLYLADGGVNISGKSNQIKFSLNTTTKKDLASRCENWFLKHDVAATTYVPEGRPQNLYVRACNKSLAHWCETFFGASMDDKNIHPLLLSSPDSVKRELLRGWLRGDGSFNDSDTSCNYVGYTTSINLAYQILQLSQNIGLKPTISKFDRENRKTQWSICFNTKDCLALFPEYATVKHILMLEGNGKNSNKNRANEPILTEFSVARKVLFTEIIPVENEIVYNFEVDVDHTYVAENILVFNCQGHAQTSVVEKAYFNKTGRIIQFSPLFAYYATQEIDGLKGSDRGSTITGGLKSAMKNGQCLLDEMPYPNPVRYRWAISQHQRDVASQYKIRSGVVCKSYDDIYQYIASGQGGVEGGLVWNNTMTPNRDGYLNDCNVSAGGGHALAFLGYTSGQDLDPDGNRYLWMANSWDVTWGLKGWAKVAKKVIDKQLHSRQGAFVGMSDLTVPGFRKVDYSLW